jgi:uncharacterized protein YecE (DUF72 family)
LAWQSIEGQLGMAAAELRIGTAGWGIASRYAGLFPADGSHLLRYAQRFGAAEINTSFYKPHQRKTYERWAQSVPADFRFSVKVPKAITHDNGLEDPGGVLDRFVGEVTGLGAKLGVLLVQLPPKLAFDAVRWAGFLDDLRRQIDTPIACEPRHASWFTADVDRLLREQRVARVAADPALHGAKTPGGWDGLAYYRWHGAPRIYYSDYDSAALAGIRQRLDASLAAGSATWCIFDNTASGAALGNALALL